MTISNLLTIPADVPAHARQTYSNNWNALTHNTHRLVLFAADQKIEHLHDDFYGPHIHESAQNPEHIFKIAQQAPIGALAIHPGLLVRNAPLHTNINYIVKLNAKTSLSSMHDDPISAPLATIEDIIRLKECSDIPIIGIGATIYVGSRYEAPMLEFASRSFLHAHAHGLITLAWVYPRGKSIADENNPHLIAGAAGLAQAIGADIVKIHPPHDFQNINSAHWLKIAVEAAGNTKVICSGGKITDPEMLLQRVYDQLHIGHTSGCAVGRNLFQRSQAQAIALARALSALVYEHQTLEHALNLWRAWQ